MDLTPISQQKKPAFSVGLQGIHKNDVEKVKQIIADTIDEVIE